MMTLEEAKALMTKESVENLHNVVDVKPTIDFSKKVNNDIIMAALCRAVADGTIKLTSLNERLVKVLNSETNTISQTKLKEVLDIIHEKQPGVYCYVWLDMFNPCTSDSQMLEWFYKDDINFAIAFGEVLEFYKVTPADVRRKLTTTLKPTIVNNVSQLVSKYRKASPKDRVAMMISITTIQRIVTMNGAMLCAEFIDNDD